MRAEAGDDVPPRRPRGPAAATRWFLGRLEGLVGVAIPESALFDDEGVLTTWLAPQTIKATTKSTTQTKTKTQTESTRQPQVVVVIRARDVVERSLLRLETRLQDLAVEAAATATATRTRRHAPASDRELVVALRWGESTSTGPEALDALGLDALIRSLCARELAMTASRPDPRVPRAFPGGGFVLQEPTAHALRCGTAARVVSRVALDARALGTWLLRCGDNGADDDGDDGDDDDDRVVEDRRDRELAPGPTTAARDWYLACGAITHAPDDSDHDKDEGQGQGQGDAAAAAAAEDDDDDEEEEEQRRQRREHARARTQSLIARHRRALDRTVVALVRHFAAQRVYFRELAIGATVVGGGGGGGGRASSSSSSSSIAITVTHALVVDVLPPAAVERLVRVHAAAATAAASGAAIGSRRRPTSTGIDPIAEPAVAAPAPAPAAPLATASSATRRHHGHHRVCRECRGAVEVELARELGRQQEALRGVLARHQRTQEEADAARRARAEAVDELGDCRRRLAEAHRALEDLRQRLREAEAEADALRAHAAAADGALAAQQHETARAREATQAAEARADALERAHEAHVAELRAAAAQETATRAAEARALETTVASQQETCDGLATTTRELRRRLEELGAECDELRFQWGFVRRRLTDVREPGVAAPRRIAGGYGSYPVPSADNVAQVVKWIVDYDAKRLVIDAQSAQAIGQRLKLKVALMQLLRDRIGGTQQQQPRRRGSPERQRRRSPSRRATAGSSCQSPTRGVEERGAACGELPTSASASASAPMAPASPRRPTLVLARRRRRKTRRDDDDDEEDDDQRADRVIDQCTNV